jgi:23S rRNA (adenine2030-N6)-methyltransferase
LFSYQHEFHAGNTADILKHTTLVYMLDSLCKKEKPFTVIDSHAGAGRFHLDDERALKTGEAQAGILNLVSKSSAGSLPSALTRYLSLERPYLSQNIYAGSPELERLIMRHDDKLFVIEKHPAAIESLSTNMTLPLLVQRPDTQSTEARAAASVTVRDSDSYEALSALTPPLIKRGLVLTDPSYEDESDYRAVSETLKLVHKKWNTAIIAVWYPLLTRKQNVLTQMLVSLEDTAKLGNNPSDWCKIELETQKPDDLTETDGAHLYGSGMFIINPPYLLKENMEDVIHYLNTLFH